MNKYFKYAFFYVTRDVPIYLIGLITNILPPTTTMNYVRGFFVRPFLGKCGKRFQLGKNVIINHPELLFLGSDCYISHNCYIQARGIVTFDNNVIIGPMSIIASSKHIIKDGMVTNKGTSLPIRIGEGTYCGGHVTINSGVSIGKSVVIGAGAVVTHDIPDNCRAYGIPAQIK